MSRASKTCCAAGPSRRGKQPSLSRATMSKTVTGTGMQSWRRSSQLQQRNRDARAPLRAICRLTSPGKSPKRRFVHVVLQSELNQSLGFLTPTEARRMDLAFDEENFCPIDLFVEHPVNLPMETF